MLLEWWCWFAVCSCGGGGGGGGGCCGDEPEATGWDTMSKVGDEATIEAVASGDVTVADDLLETTMTPGATDSGAKDEADTCWSVLVA